MVTTAFAVEGLTCGSCLAEVLEQFPDERRLRMPMRPQCRSLNLSNAVAVSVFEAWRQQGFPGGA